MFKFKSIRRAWAAIKAELNMWHMRDVDHLGHIPTVYDPGNERVVSYRIVTCGHQDFSFNARPSDMLLLKIMRLRRVGRLKRKMPFYETKCVMTNDFFSGRDRFIQEDRGYTIIGVEVLA